MHWCARLFTSARYFRLKTFIVLTLETLAVLFVALEITIPRRAARPSGVKNWSVERLLRIEAAVGVDEVLWAEVPQLQGIHMQRETC